MFAQKYKNQHKKRSIANICCLAFLGLVAVLSLIWMIHFVKLMAGGNESNARKNGYIREVPPTNAHLEVKAVAEVVPVEAVQQKIEISIAVTTAVTTTSITSIAFFTQKDCEGSTYSIDENHPDANSIEGCKGCYDTCDRAFPDNGPPWKPGALSARVTGTGDVDLHWHCSKDEKDTKYWGSISAIDGCVNIFDWPNWGQLRFVPGTLTDPSWNIPAARDPRKDNPEIAKYVIAYSVESSTYFGYQAYASLHGFMMSKQTDASYMRLLTCEKPDDLAEDIPTFTAKRHPYSKRYGPLNKPDVLTKWFASSQAPKEEVVVVIDPDNWLTEDLRPWVDQVKPGHGLAQRAFYGGSTRTVAKMYKEFCTDIMGDGHCDNDIYMAAVPYMLHREDFSRVAPLWKMYSLLIKEGIEKDNSIASRYRSVQVEWCAEMFGFNMACAHLGINIQIEGYLQIRDIETRAKDRVDHVPMIHMGRAWFHDEKAAAPWKHTEGRDFRHFGHQVWCKCNVTGNDILPWPIADDLDYVSDVTLRYLHDSREKYGKPPMNEFRGNYHEAHA